ncbi:MAG: sigma 54-interacting transcriptional regulator, partial [bacterium]
GGGELDEDLEMLIRSHNLYGQRELRGESRATQQLRERVQLVGKQSHCRVLIQGETGTGKETVAGLIHEYSTRSAEPLICFNCADLSPHLLESRLFGHEKGAFTGALQAREGAFEQADGGTLFLDEVAELSADAQAGLLRVLEEGRFYRLGGSEERSVDVRVVAATNRNLPGLVAEGRFRDDLYHRLATVPVVIPPLRERPEDIAPIADDFWRHLTGNGRLNKAQTEALTSYPWPGNVRELRNVLERAQALGQSDFAKLLEEHRHLSAGLPGNESVYAENLEEMKIQHIRRILRKYDGNITRAANALGIARNTLKKYGGES